MICKLCETDRNKVLFKAKSYDICKCDSCGFVFISPIPDDETIAKIYQSEYFDKGKYIDDFATQMEYKRRRSLLEKYLTPTTTILDFGCASGDFVNFLKNDANIFGVDVSDDAINLAKVKYLDIENKFRYLNELTSLNVKFDVIVLWDVIEHLKDPLKTMQNLVKLLSTDGVIILSTPNIGAFTAKLMKSKWAFMTPPEHLCFFDKQSMYYLGKSLKGKVIYWSTKGKWVNIAFLFYKIKRIFPNAIPQGFINFLKKYFNKVSLYVPTQDIQYTIIKM